MTKVEMLALAEEIEAAIPEMVVSVRETTSAEDARSLMAYCADSIAVASHLRARALTISDEEKTR